MRLTCPKRFSQRVGLAAVREESQDVLVLLVGGVGDGHPPLGEPVATVALRAETFAALQTECTEFPLRAVIQKTVVERLAGAPEMSEADLGSVGILED